MDAGGYHRHVAQVGDDPALSAFSAAARSRQLWPGWEFVGGIPDEPVPAEQAYRWSWTETLRLPVPSMLFFGITLLAVALLIPEGVMKSPYLLRWARAISATK